MFRIVTDTSANLPTDYLHAEQITVIPYTFQSGKGCLLYTSRCV